MRFYKMQLSGFLGLGYVINAVYTFTSWLYNCNPVIQTRLNCLGSECLVHCPGVQLGIAYLQPIKVASAANGFCKWSVTVIFEKTGLYSGRQGDRQNTEHAERITCWPLYAREGGGVGGGQSVITFLGQVRERSFSRCFYTNRHKQRTSLKQWHVKAGSDRVKGH